MDNYILQSTNTSWRKDTVGKFCFPPVLCVDPTSRPQHTLFICFLITISSTQINLWLKATFNIAKNKRGSKPHYGISTFHTLSTKLESYKQWWNYKINCVMPLILSPAITSTNYNCLRQVIVSKLFELIPQVPQVSKQLTISKSKHHSNT